MQAHTQIQSPAERRATLEATSDAAAAAHDAHLQDAMSSVVWERRGFLRVLRRVARPAHPGAGVD
jgi:hypothetical protein